LQTLRWLLVTGEALPPELCREWGRAYPGVPLVNAYGPTECSDDVTHHFIHEPPAAGVVQMPIGRPIQNTRLYILDEHLRPVPVGVFGEVYVGGVGVGRGYLGDPRRTAGVFTPDPFGDEPGARLYRTGDLARYLPGGEIEFAGRIDHQVKVHGFRIELGEVEAALARHGGVRESVVVAAGQGEQRLIAYVVAAQDGAPDAVELRGFLKERLPEYMIPSAFVTLEAMPLLANGKVNRRALPAPEQALAAAERTYTAPRNDVEAALVEIWEELLGVSPVGVTDNFFDLGGHSLLAVRMTARIQKQFGREIPLAKLFQGATVEYLAEVLGQRTEAPPWSPLVPIRPEGSKRPLFCVHALGGDVLSFYHLSRHLQDDQPLYALQAPRLHELRDAFISIEEYAAKYVEAIRRVQPEGPYLLGGYSFGGTVVFEMARQLRAQGQELGLLAIFDTLAPSLAHVLPSMDDTDLLVGLAWAEARAREKFLRLSAEHMRRLEPEARLEYFIEEMRRAEITPMEIELEMLRSFLTGFRSRQEASRLYRPAGDYEGRLTLFRCEQPDEETQAYLKQGGVDELDPAYGWGAHVSAPVEIHVVPGHHNVLFLEPHVRDLARSITAVLA
jgi:thioesterase domain-containing protein/acyl carrier protein